MKYVSTRGQAPELDFAGVLLAGLAADGGLYVPAAWPVFSAAELRAMRGLPYPELAAKVIAPFVGDCDVPPGLCRIWAPGSGAAGAAGACDFRA